MDSSTRTIALSALTSFIVSGLVFGAGTAMLLQKGVPVLQPDQKATVTPAVSLTSSTTNTSIIDVVKKTEPAVVSVIISKDLPVMQRSLQTIPFGFGNGQFQIQVPQLRQNGTQNQEIGGGTAFFISSDGLLMTNKHVVSDEKADYTVLLNDGRKLKATVIARDTVNDIALLKVDGSNFPSLQFANSNPELGESVIAIGNALGEFRNTVSVGVISGLQRSIMAGSAAQGSLEQLNHILQTDAAINEGNSGGPLLDGNGNVIGMSTAIASDAQNIGFAIPVEELSYVLKSYQKNGHIVRPYIGVRYVPITPAMATEEKLAVDHGVLVTHGETPADVAVLQGSPADNAGVKDGDIILKIDAQDLTDTFALNDYIQTKNPGDTVTLTILRGGKQQDLRVILEERKE